MRSNMLFVALVLGLITCAKAPAHADSITYNSGSLVINPYRTGSGTAAATLPQFAPALGQLTSADFAINWDLTGTGAAYTYYPDEIGFAIVKINSHFTLTTPNATPLVDTNVHSENYTTIFGFYNSIVAYNRGSGVGSLLATGTEADLFLGTNTITLPLDFHVDVTYDFSDGSGGLDNLRGSAEASVTYNFSPAPVPEPGSIALLAGMGISGAGFLVRRRKNAHQAA